jgi:putative ABC transport system ATP-binding protein
MMDELIPPAQELGSNDSPESESSDEREVIVKLENVSKAFKRKPVIRNFNLAVKAGEFLAVTGPSGSGKSTLLNIIGILESPSGGTVWLFDKIAPRINSGRGRKLLREKISYLFQNAALIDQESVEANLRLVQKYQKGTAEEKRNARMKALETVGLSVSPDQKIYELSGGEQQRLALAQIVLRPHSLILADEPTGSLDDLNRDQVLDILETLHQSGKTLIVVTHDAEVYSRADRVVNLVERTSRRRVAARG